MKISSPRFIVDATCKFTEIHKFSCSNTNDFIPIVGSSNVPSREVMQMNNENKISFPRNNFIEVYI